MDAKKTTQSATTDSHAVLDTLEKVEAHHRRRESDQRRASRRSVRLEAIMTPLLESGMCLDPIRISVRDISMTGMGFISSVPIPPGTLWRMALLIDRHALGQQTFTVRHCRAVSSGIYVIGAQFCADPTLLTMIGLKLDEMVVRRSPDDLYDVEFVSPDSLL